ncbi:MAG TPA: redoxin domain-containing protein [Nitrososphaera sp.]|nr:redoxin domain-containing protein [Nitrososphaera sp.]
MFQPGSPAPDFALKSTPDHTVSLAELRNRPVVLVFYPADFSPETYHETTHYSTFSRLLACVIFDNPPLNPIEPEVIDELRGNSLRIKSPL